MFGVNRESDLNNFFAANILTKNSQFHEAEKECGQHKKVNYAPLYNKCIPIYEIWSSNTVPECVNHLIVWEWIICGQLVVEVF